MMAILIGINFSKLQIQSEILQFNIWLKDHPELMISSNPLYGEIVNGDIATKFFDYCKKEFG